MRTDRTIAFNLRKQGISYNEINKQLGIPKSTLSNWFKDNLQSIRIKESLILKAQTLAAPKLRLLAKNHISKSKLRYKQYRQDAESEFPKLVCSNLFVAGLMLYWGEGDKVLKNGILRLVNTDPAMIKLYYLFLKKVVHIQDDDIHFRLTLYKDLGISSYTFLWSKILGVSPRRFKKAAVITGRHPNKIISYGMCSVEVYRRELKEKMIHWIYLYQNREIAKLIRE